MIEIKALIYIMYVWEFSVTFLHFVRSILLERDQSKDTIFRWEFRNGISTPSFVNKNIIHKIHIIEL